MSTADKIMLAVVGVYTTVAMISAALWKLK